MPDNVGYTAGTGTKIASREVSYSGETAQSQSVGIVTFAGSDDAKTATDVDASNPFPTYPRDSAATTSFSAVTTASTALFASQEMSNECSLSIQLTGLWAGSISLQQSNDNTTWWDVQGLSQSHGNVLVSSVSAPDVITVHCTARYFRAITSSDFAGSVSGSYVARSIEPPKNRSDVTIADIAADVSVPVSAITPQGYPTKIAANNLGHLILADNESFTRVRSSIGTLIQLETTGYNSVSIQLYAQVTFTATVTFQVSNDGTNWNAISAWPVGGAAVPVTTATAAGHWLIPVIGRFFRAQVTAYTSGVIGSITVLKSQSAWMPISTPSMNTAQIGGTAVVTAGVAGMQAVGGNVAEDAAVTANPLMNGGIVRIALPATTVAAGDAIRQTYSRSAQIITKEGAPGDLDFYVQVTVTTNTRTLIRGAQTTGICQNITSIIYQNTNATATTLNIDDGTSAMLTISVPASMNEPRQLLFPTPLRGSPSTNLNYSAGTTGANILLHVMGYNSY